MATFHLFSSLAPELRNKIWRDTLPNYIGPALYFYRHRGCWCPRPLIPSDPGYIPGNDEVGFQFRTDLLGDDNQFQVPLAFVNREARGIAVAWLRDQGIEIRPRERGKWLFTRPFNPELDALYVPLERWEDFCLEPTDRMLEPDLQGRSADLETELTSIAVPEELFWQSEAISWLPEMEMWFEHLRVLYVVMGQQPDHVQGPWRWEFEGVGGGTFSWNKDDDEFELQEGDEGFRDETLCERVKDAARSGLREQLVSCQLESLEIRTVSAVRR